MTKKKMELSEQIHKKLGVEVSGDPMTFDYDQWLELFRKVPAGKIAKAEDWLNENLPVEGFAAASRWIEIIDNPTKMDKLYQGRLRAGEKESIMELAVGDNDEAFYEALIRENVAKLDESRSSAQEVARITQNLNIFRKQLREIRSHKPKQGSVLQKVLELSAKPPNSAKKVPKTLNKKKGEVCKTKTRRKKQKSSTNGAENSSNSSEPKESSSSTTKQERK